MQRSNAVRKDCSSQQLLRFPDIKRRVGLSRSEIYRRISLQEFPKPIKLGARTVAWPVEVVDCWIAERIKESKT